MRNKIFITFSIVLSLVIGWFIEPFITSTAKADCRPAQTLTNTDYTRMLQAVDDFIEGNYLQDNVTWEVASAAHPSPRELSADIYVGPMSTPNLPGELNSNKSKLYDIVISRECANEGWTVTKFERRIKNP